MGAQRAPGHEAALIPSPGEELGCTLRAVQVPLPPAPPGQHSTAVSPGLFLCSI